MKDDKESGIIRPVRIQLSRDTRRGIKYEIGLPQNNDEMDEPSTDDEE